MRFTRVLPSSPAPTARLAVRSRRGHGGPQSTDDRLLRDLGDTTTIDSKPTSVDIDVQRLRLKNNPSGSLLPGWTWRATRWRWPTLHTVSRLKESALTGHRFDARSSHPEARRQHAPGQVHPSPSAAGVEAVTEWVNRRLGSTLFRDAGRSKKWHKVAAFWGLCATSRRSENDITLVPKAIMPGV